MSGGEAKAFLAGRDLVFESSRRRVRAGPSCLNGISASISGASAGVRPPSGMTVG
jgi:hypothetical protein